MTWVSRLVEEQLAEAAAAGELVAEPLKGRPIPGIDERRPDGWWTAGFVRRERSHDRRKVAVARAARARAGFWRAESVDELRRLVAEANTAIVRANVNLIADDQLDGFDLDDVIARWRALRR